MPATVDQLMARFQALPAQQRMDLLFEHREYLKEIDYDLFLQIDETRKAEQAAEREAISRRKRERNRQIRIDRIARQMRGMRGRLNTMKRQIKRVLIEPQPSPVPIALLPPASIELEPARTGLTLAQRMAQAWDRLSSAAPPAPLGAGAQSADDPAEPSGAVVSASLIQCR